VPATAARTPSIFGSPTENFHELTIERKID
jgi:hypothetical protein